MKYTAEANRAIRLADERARRLELEFTRVEDLLVVLAGPQLRRTHAVMTRLGLDEAFVNDFMTLEAPVFAPRTNPLDQTRLQKVLGHADEIAISFGDEAVDSVHQLLAIARHYNGAPGRCFRTKRVSVQNLMHAIYPELAAVG